MFSAAGGTGAKSSTELRVIVAMVLFAWFVIAWFEGLRSLVRSPVGVRRRLSATACRSS